MHPNSKSPVTVIFIFHACTLRACSDLQVPDYKFGVGGASVTVEATAYGWAPIPMMSVYDKATGLPVLPWNRSIEGGTSILSLV